MNDPRTPYAITYPLKLCNETSYRHKANAIRIHLRGIIARKMERMTFDSANSIIASNTVLLTICCAMYYTTLLVFITVTKRFLLALHRIVAIWYRLCNNYSTAILLILSKSMLLHCYFFPLAGSLLLLYCHYHCCITVLEVLPGSNLSHSGWIQNGAMQVA